MWKVDDTEAVTAQRGPRPGIAFALAIALVSLVACGAGRSALSCGSHVGPVPSPQLGQAGAPDTVTGTMVSVPAGEFSMGDAFADDDERPVRTVELAAFEIDRTEVTVRAYAACVAAGMCTPAGEDPYCNWVAREKRREHPINCVSWSDATAFCSWAGKRLPSENEWEFAARGPSARRYPWGDGAPGGQLCWDGAGSDAKSGERRGTCVVASHAAGRSPFGAEDMAGNVLEWTTDAYTANYRAPPSATHRVNRGGSWITYDGRDVRASQRFRMTPARRDFTVGFRCVR